MSKAIAISRTAYERARQHQADMLGSVIVITCGMALILAGPALPL